MRIVFVHQIIEHPRSESDQFQIRGDFYRRKRFFGTAELMDLNIQVPPTEASNLFFQLQDM
ncbi:hypothetical protein CDO73_20960 [Saccharibacillus sp. O23]|nr:hypothetical protein CDO73_20960 [Saccharibacillus sp. O23]